MGHGRHAHAANGRHAADGNGRLLHAHHASASEILHPCSDQSSAKMASAASCSSPRRYARHGNAQRTSPRSPHGRSSSRPNGSARTSAHDHDGSPWYAPSPDGSPASQTSAELQVHPHCQESTCSGDAWTDGCPWRSSTSTTGCACPGTGTSDCLHVGSCSSRGCSLTWLARSLACCSRSTTLSWST